MPRKYLSAALAALLLCALLLLPACAGKPASEREAELERETATLRARVERLEQESAAERASRAEDMAALRQDLRELHATLEETSRGLAASHFQGSALDNAAEPGAPAHAEKSPRQALRDSLRNMVEASRKALERLSRELDTQLEKHKSKPKAAPPAPEEPAR
ncbi:MAG: hypothetical protein Q7I92_07320 [Humidesulfovibrio sp.]|nr:hypothetical protein [Humidesulfovibrio sp.]